MSSWALPSAPDTDPSRPRPKADSSGPSADPPPAASSALRPHGRLWREVSPFLPKRRDDKGKVSETVARMSDDDLETMITKTEALIRRAGTSASSIVLQKRLDGLILEHSIRRLRRTTINGTAGEQQPDDVRLQLERIRIKEEIASDVESIPNTARRRLVDSVHRPRGSSRMGVMSWDDSAALLRDEYRRDMAARQAAEELETKRARPSAARLRGIERAKQEALMQFMFAGPDDDDVDDDDDDESDDGSGEEDDVIIPEED